MLKILTINDIALEEEAHIPLIRHDLAGDLISAGLTKTSENKYDLSFEAHIYVFSCFCQSH